MYARVCREFVRRGASRRRAALSLADSRNGGNATEHTKRRIQLVPQVVISATSLACDFGAYCSHRCLFAAVARARARDRACGRNLRLCFPTAPGGACPAIAAAAAAAQAARATLGSRHARGALPQPPVFFFVWRRGGGAAVARAPRPRFRVPPLPRPPAPPRSRSPPLAARRRALPAPPAHCIKKKTRAEMSSVGSIIAQKARETFGLVTRTQGAFATLRAAARCARARGAARRHLSLPFRPFSRADLEVSKLTLRLGELEKDVTQLKKCLLAQVRGDARHAALPAPRRASAAPPLLLAALRRTCACSLRSCTRRCRARARRR